MSISLIVAVSKNNGIGLNNKLLFKIPTDMEWFKMHTTNKPVVMGRKTFESIGRPLPNRTNIVLTRDTSFTAEGVIVIHKAFDVFHHTLPHDEIMVIGGSEIYSRFMHWADRLYLTRVDKEVEADTFFEWDVDEWKSLGGFQPVTFPEEPPMRFEVLERKR